MLNEKENIRLVYHFYDVIRRRPLPRYWNAERGAQCGGGVLTLTIDDVCEHESRRMLRVHIILQPSIMNT